MKCSVTAVLCCAAVLQIGGTVSDNSKPGVDIRLTRKGLNYAGQTGANILREKIIKTKVPDYDGRKGLIKYKVSDISFSGIEPIYSVVSKDPSKSLTWILRNVSFDMTANFTVSFCIFKSYGNLQYSLENTSLYLPLTVGVDKNGRPTLKSACHYSSQNSQISFFGHHAALFNWMVKTFRGAFYAFVQKLVCSALTYQVDKATMMYFSKYQTNQSIGGSFSVDYRLLTSPSYNTTHMDIPLRGETFWTKKRANSSVPVPDLLPFTVTSRMMYIFVTDYVFNTLNEVAFKQEQLDKLLTSMDLPPDQRYFLNTTCPGNLCFGKLIAQTARMFPNSMAELHIKSSERPVLTVSPGSVSMTFAANINFYVRQPNGTTAYMFSIKARLDAQLHVLPSEIASLNRISAVINQTSLSVGILDSTIGAIDLNLLKTLMDTIVNLYIQPQLNKLGSTGFPLPLLGVEYKNVQIILAQNAIVIGTDFKFRKKNVVRPGYKVVGLDNQEKQAKMSFQAVDGSNGHQPIKITML